MGAPTAQDYNEAIQNPEFAFFDTELQRGQPDAWPATGLPKPVSGNFASVYRMRNGDKSWAVRCFIREVPDLEVRYEAIDRHLSSIHLPYFVPFHYLEKGIRVSGKWYPIVKMEWIKGTSLYEYVHLNLRNPAVLLGLAERWLRMMHDLRKANLAHGDLQHGNILIRDGNFVLIDYDGMYVPEMKGQRSNELGHRNYQHPARTPSHFGPFLDNYSAYVIYLSLLALSISPELFSDDRETLIFHKIDFELPWESTSFQRVYELHNTQLRHLNIKLFEFLTMDPSEVPPLDGEAILKFTRQQQAGASVALPSWMGGSSDVRDDEFSRGNITLLLQDVLTPPSSWILDHLTAAPRNLGSLHVNRITGKLWLAALLAVSTWFSYGISNTQSEFIAGSVFLYTLVLLVFIAVLYDSYGRNEVIAIKSALKKEHLDIAKALEDLLATARAIKHEHEVLLDKHENQIRQIEEQYAGLNKGVQEEVLRLRQAFKEKAGVLEQDRLQMKTKENEELYAIARDIHRDISEVNDSIARLEQVYAKRRQEVLDEVEERFVAGYLAQFRVSDADIPLFNQEAKSRLYKGGFHTAANIDYNIHLIEGIDKKQAATLSQWISELRQLARKSMPSRLLRVDQDEALAHIRTQQDTLMRKKRAFQEQEQIQKNNIQRYYADIYSEIAQAKRNLERRQFELEKGKMLGRRIAENNRKCQAKVRESALGKRREENELIELLVDLKPRIRQRQLQKEMCARNIEQYKKITFWTYIRRTLF